MEESPAAAASRTILFADVSGSTRIIETAGDVTGRAFVAGILDEVSRITDDYGGTVIKTIGDEVMSSFEEAVDAVGAAVQMQRVVRTRESLGDVLPRIKIGLHSGEVIVEPDDLFGDAVNVATWVVSMAKADQILTTALTFDALEGVGIPTRSLGSHDARGRGAALEIVEVLWEINPDELTTLGRSQKRQASASHFELRIGDSTVIELAGGGGSVHSLGREEENEIVVPDTSASRFHADIIVRGGRFYLSDHSTNGTYVRPDGGVEMFVHRDEVLLGGEGTIRLGRTSSDPEGPTLRYRVS